MDHKSDSRQDAWMAASLSALTILSRIPFCSQILYHWDSVNFAYAIREFNIAKEQPQPPGYIVYVWLCRLVNLLFSDAQTTMVAINIIASALAVVALFYLGRSMFSRRTGLIAGLFLSTSPLFWFYGEIALPHTLDALLVIVSVWWLYETMQGRSRYLYPAVAAMAVAGGVRQQTIIFLVPLLLFALRRVGWKHFLNAGLLGAMICLVWFVPLMTLSGGFSNYTRVMGAFTRRFQSTTSVFMGGGWWGVRRNVQKLAMYTLYGWGAALVPGMVYVVSQLRYRVRLQRWEKPIFLSLWIAPALIFYSIVHMGQQGLVFVFMPALLLLSAVGLARLLVTQSRWLTVATAVLVALNAGIFLLAPEYPLGPNTQRLLTRATLVNSDRYYRDRFRAIEEGFAPESTVILAANWHHVEYYLPAYRFLPFSVVSKWEVGEGQAEQHDGETQVLDAEALGLIPDRDGRVQAVIFDTLLAKFNETPTLTQASKLEHGDTLAHFTLGEEDSLRYGAQSFGLIER